MAGIGPGEVVGVESQPHHADHQVWNKKHRRCSEPFGNGHVKAQDLAEIDRHTYIC